MPTKTATAPVPVVKAGEKYEDLQGRIWRVLEANNNQIRLIAAGGGAVGNLNLARKAMRGWRKDE